MILMYSLSDGEGSVSPGIALEPRELSLEISLLVTVAVSGGAPSSLAFMFYLKCLLTQRVLLTPLNGMCLINASLRL